MADTVGGTLLEMAGQQLFPDVHDNIVANILSGTTVPEKKKGDADAIEEDKDGEAKKDKRDGDELPILDEEEMEIVL